MRKADLKSSDLAKRVRKLEQELARLQKTLSRRSKPDTVIARKLVLTDGKGTLAWTLASAKGGVLAIDSADGTRAVTVSRDEAATLTVHGGSGWSKSHTTIDGSGGVFIVDDANRTLLSLSWDDEGGCFYLNTATGERGVEIVAWEGIGGIVCASQALVDSIEMGCEGHFGGRINLRALPGEDAVVELRSRPGSEDPLSDRTGEWLQLRASDEGSYVELCDTDGQVLMAWPKPADRPEDTDNGQKASRKGLQRK